MSNRQERNVRKARRRKAKLLDAMHALEAREGITLSVALHDFDWAIALAATRHVDGHRHAVMLRRDRLWRRMDDVPVRMHDVLKRWLDAHPPSA